MSNEQLVVGFVRGAHGVTGEFKVESASGDYEHIEILKVFVFKNSLFLLFVFEIVDEFVE